MDTENGSHSRRAERLLIPAIFITSLGNNIQVIAASLLLVRAEKTMLSVGWLFIAVAIPQAVLSPLFGRLADRVDRRRLWFGCDLASAAAALSLLGRLILLYAQSSVIVSVFNALLPTFIIVELHRGSATMGVVDALGGLGFLLSAAAYRVISPRMDDLPIALAGFMLTAIVLVLQPQYGVIGLVPGVLCGAWVLGQGRIAARALLLTSVPESRAGRVFGLANGYGLAGTVVVMLGVSDVTDHSDSRYGFATLGVLTAVITLSVLVASLLTHRQTRRVEALAPLVPAEQPSTPTV